MLKLKSVILFVFVTVGSWFVLPTASYATNVVPFEEIMSLMKGADITYERVGHYKRPFKVLKDGDDWMLENQKNWKSSPIKKKGNNKFSTTQFPASWTINGTWTFSKNGSKCRIDHEDGGMVMRWACP